MKNLKMALLMMLFSSTVLCQVGQIQQVKIISLNVKNQLPAVIDNWNNTPGALLLVAQVPPTSKVESMRLMLHIRSNGAVICGNNSTGGILVDRFNTRSFTTQELTAAFAMCRELKDGTYTLCAQFYNIDHVAISNEMCRDFTVETPRETDYSPPTLITPDNGKNFTEAELQRPVMFRWTPLVPKPKEPVTYRLRVWQLMQGQTAQAAMRSNQPIVTKEVDNLTQTIVTGVITGPCRPPYMCDFIWSVQAVNREGKPMGRNDGTSEPWTFGVLTQYIIQLDSLKVKCTDVPGQYSFSYIITNLNNTVAQFQNISIYSSVPPGATLTSYSPTLGTTIPASGGTLTVTGIINGAPNLSIVCIKTKIQKQGDPGKNAEDYLCDTVKPCRCEACDEKTTNINIVPANNIVVNGNNTITLNQPITITTTPPKLVKNIKAELVYFEFTPESEECLPCNKDSKTYGNFDNGTLAAVTGIGGGTHSLQWNFTPPKNFAGGNTAAIIISLPPTVGCCSASIRWCIRYVVTFADCTVCNKLVCYETKKAGCANGNPNPNGQK